MSRALIKWRTSRSAELKQLLSAHQLVGGAGPGRRRATEQLNFAYLVSIAAQFQGFCRDLHSEAVNVVVGTTPVNVSGVLRATLTKNRKLDQGNANSASIAEDFSRIGMSDFWKRVALYGGEKRTKLRLARLEQMNIWRNAIAHNNFEQNQSRIDLLDGRLRPRLVEAGRCRTAVDQLTGQVSEAVGGYLGQLVGTSPW